MAWPGYIPLYYLFGGTSKDNWMEKQADKVGNEAYEAKQAGERP